MLSRRFRFCALSPVPARCSLQNHTPLPNSYQIHFRRSIIMGKRHHLLPHTNTFTPIANQPPMPEASATTDVTPTASVPPFRWRSRGLLQTLCARSPTILRTLATAMATIVLMAAGLLAWRFYDAWRLGRIELTTVDAPVVCQVLAESTDTPIGEPFDLVTRAIVSLPAGDFRLHIRGEGRLSRTYRFGVTRGETQTHEISLDEGRLLGGERAAGFGGDERPRDIPIPFAPFIMALELTRGRSDLVERSGDSVRRRDGASGAVLWDTSHPAQPFAPDRDPATQMQGYSSCRGGTGSARGTGGGLE